MIEFFVSPDVYSAETDAGTLVLLHYPSGDFYTLDELGAVIWHQLVEGCLPETIATRITEEYDAEYHQVLADIHRLLRELLSCGLITKKS